MQTWVELSSCHLCVAEIKDLCLLEMLCRIRHNSSVPDLSFPIALIVCQIESEEFQYQDQLEVGNMRGEKEQGEMARRGGYRSV